MSFAFETTLASRSLAAWIRELREGLGYRLHLVYLWLPDVETAVARVRAREAAGGHRVPEETVRRRYGRGLDNFFVLYRNVATTWRFYDNSGTSPRLIASGREQSQTRVYDSMGWTRVLEAAGHE